MTGASGFLGRPLCAELQRRGFVVRAAARHPVPGPWDEFQAYDVREPVPPALLAGVGNVFHLAGKAHAMTARDDEAEHRQITAEGTMALVRAASEAGISSLVFVSSVKAAGEGGDQLVDEEFRGAPTTPYGRAKLRAEQAVLDAAGSGIHVAVLRPTVVYGPNWKGNLARMFAAVAAGRFPPLPDTGNRRSLVHVDDVVSAALLAAERPPANGRVYILTDGEAYSTRRIYEAMCRAAGRRVPERNVPLGLLRIAARAGDALLALGIRRVPFESAALDRLTGSAWYDSSRARRELGWAPLHTLEESLPSIVAAAELSGAGATAADGRT